MPVNLQLVVSERKPTSGREAGKLADNHLKAMRGATETDNIDDANLQVELKMHMDGMC